MFLMISYVEHFLSQVPIGYLYISFGKCLFRSFADFFNGVFIFFAIELFKFL